MHTRGVVSNAKGGVVDVVEAAYRLDGTDETWLSGLLERAGPLMDRGLGVFGYVYDLRAPDPWANVEFVTTTVRSDVLAKLSAMTRLAPRSADLPHAKSGPFGTASQAVGETPRQAKQNPVLREWLHPLGVRDVLGLNARDPTGLASMLVAPMPDYRRPTPAAVVRFGQVAAHITAGLRLRRTLDREASDEDAEAIVDASGKVVHATTGTPTAYAVLPAATACAVLPAAVADARRRPQLAHIAGARTTTGAVASDGTAPPRSRVASVVSAAVLVVAAVGAGTVWLVRGQGGGFRAS